MGHCYQRNVLLIYSVPVGRIEKSMYLLAIALLISYFRPSFRRYRFYLFRTSSVVLYNSVALTVLFLSGKKSSSRYVMSLAAVLTILSLSALRR